ncbi:protein regulator of cytokinesis 1-like [Styela clava]
MRDEIDEPHLQLDSEQSVTSNMTMGEKLHSGSKKSELAETVESRILMLERIWNELGIPEEQVQARYQTVCKHVKNLLQRMVNEENKLLQSTKRKLSDYENKIADLTAILGATPRVNRHASRIQEPKSLILKKHQLECALDQLQCMSEKRKLKMATLVKKAEKLSSNLSEPPHDLVTNFKQSDIPSQSDIDSLKRYIYNLQQKECMRRQRLSEQRRRLLNLMEEMEIEPSTDLELEIVITDDSQFRLDAETRKQHSSLEERLLKTKEERMKLATYLRDEFIAICKKDQIEIDEEIEHLFSSIKTSHLDLLKTKFERLSLNQTCRKTDNKASNDKSLHSKTTSTTKNNHIANNSAASVPKCFDTPVDVQKDRQPNLGTPFCRKLKRRSISDTTLGGSDFKSKQQGSHTHKHLSPFRFGMARNGTAWQTAGTATPNTKSVPRQNKIHQRTISV